MEELAPSQDQHYIQAPSPRAVQAVRVLKYGETFAVFDHFGDIQPAGLGEEGLYHEGTRFLSRLRLRVNHRRPLLLSSTVRQDNALLAVDLTNPDIHDGEQLLLPRDMLHILRSCFLWSGRCYMRFRVRNFSRDAVRAILEVSFEADFADIFEVRGERRPRRGRLLARAVGENHVELPYEGLDGAVRRTRLRFSPPPRRLSKTAAEFELAIPPAGERECYVTISCESDGEGNSQTGSPGLGYEQALERYSEELQESQAADAVIHTSNTQFNQWLQRSRSDLHLMITQTPHGPYPYAGVPWFSTAFGRDGIITALEYLWINPRWARGVLRYLAATQADRADSEQDAQPGKVLHETRKGEMAALGEIPFGRYYGTVDATPLFVVLAGAYYKRTGDHALIESIWPNIARALQWIDDYADLDGDGFFEYSRQSSTGLVTQGWKDSFDSVFHADGSLAEGPIALCEVQGYVYAAWRAAARLATLLGHRDLAASLSRRAVALRQRFEETFWCPDLGTYAIALDGSKRLCRVRTSNAGHCLLSGIARSEAAKQTARTLLHESSFSGWGVRTVAAGESRYNPMSYHNGSIWPHDNALIAYGLARYGLKKPVVKILSGLFDASQFVDLHRMPELFCGFTRRAGQGPTLYPVACAPQSWAAGAVFLLIKACLGISIQASRRRIRFHRPSLPESLQHVTIRNLQVGDAAIDFSIQRHAEDVGINILRRQGSVEVVVVK